MKFWTVSWEGFGNFTQPSDQPKPNMDRFSSSLSAQSPRKRDDGLAKRPPGRGRWRPSQSVKSPNCLRRLTPQSRFVPAQAVKQARVKIGKAQQSLGDGSGLQAWFERWMHGR